MPDILILHRATRVARRVTIDPNLVLASDEVAVRVPEGRKIDLSPAGSVWVYNPDGTRRPATVQEARDAEMDVGLERAIQALDRLKAAGDKYPAEWQTRIDDLLTRMRT